MDNSHMTKQSVLIEGNVKEEKAEEDKTEENKNSMNEQTQILWFDPLELKVCKYNVRTGPDADKDIDKMVNSISQVGVLEPLIITEDRKVICGQRRWVAAKILREQYERDIKVPCIVLRSERHGYETLISLIENLRSKMITEENFGKSLLFLEALGWTLDEVSRATGESVSTLHMIKDRARPPSLPKGGTQKQISQFISSRKRLSHKRRRVTKKLQKAFPDDIVKQIRVANFVEKAPIEFANEIVKETRKKLPFHVEEHIRRAEAKIPLETHVIRIRQDVDKQVIKRLRREVDKDFQLLVEKLLETWANYKLCQECEELI